MTYWMFRIMMGAGAAMLLVSIVGLWLTRKGRLPKSKLVWKLAMFCHRRADRRPIGRLDLHRDGPPALDGGRAVPDSGSVSPSVSRRLRC